MGLAAGIIALALAACAPPAPAPGAQAEVASGAEPAAQPSGLSIAAPIALAFAPSGDPGFDAWRQDFAARALSTGRSERVVRQLLDGLTPDPAAIRSDRSQAEVVRPWWDYVSRAVSDVRVARGAERLAQSRALFEAVESRYGVSPGVIAGIWGLESNFGAAPLPHDAPRVLATLAYEGRRRAAFEGWLLALMDMVERGYAGPEELRSSWAGALGQPQFMPDTYLSRAVDWDGDGRRDIWTNEGDVVASIANYLAEAGWRRGEPAFMEVRLPEGFDYALADNRTRRSVAAWAALGVGPVAAAFAEADLALEARLFLPAGAGGPALLLLANYDAIRRYNPSDRYAMAVALLGRRIEGGAGLAAGWPGHLRTLTTSQARQLQEGLNALGFDAGVVDGVVGPGTRAALARFQAAQGLPADGFPTAAMLGAVRAAQTGADRNAPLDQAGVARLQARLAALGYDIGAADGRPGARTRAAIEAFERSAGLPVTGAAQLEVLLIAEALAGE